MTPDDAPVAEYVPLTKERIDAAVVLVWAVHERLTEAEEPDHDAARRAIYERVIAAEVTSKAERREKALRRYDLVTDVWPRLAHAEQWRDQDDPDLAEAVYKWFDQWTWRTVKASFDGPVQRIVAVEQPGLVLCQTTLGKGQDAAVYVTRDLGCILEDYAATFSRKVKSAALAFGDNLAFVTARLPQHADTFSRTYKREMKVALNAGEGALSPALTAASADSDGEPAGE